MLKIKKIILIFMISFIFTFHSMDAEIHEAAKIGDLEKIRLLLKTYPKLVNTRDSFGKTPLHWACMGVHKEIVKYLVGKGADVNARDMSAITPLHSLSIRGHKECVELLIKKGADIGAKEINGANALFYAAYGGYKDVAEIFIDQGARINARNNNGLTPTDWAIDNGHEETGRFLISKGGKPTPVKEAKVSHITDYIYKLTFPYYQPTNIIVFSGSNGVLLIDTGFRRTAKKLKSTIEKLTKGKIKYIINTHQHRDHIGGNFIADNSVKIINCTNLDQMVSNGILKKGKGSIKGKSGKIFETYYAMNFNNREIRLIPSPGAHTETDLIVHMVDSGIVHMGDLLISQSFPSLTRGAKVLEYLDILDKVFDVFPEDTKFTAGHGRNLTMKEFKDYQKMLLTSIDIVRKGMKTGKSVMEMQKRKVLKDYNSYNTFIPELNTDFWIGAVCRSYEKKRSRDHENN